MAGIQFDVHLDDVVAQDRLAAITSALDDLTPLMDEIGGALVNGAIRRIGTSNVGPDGTPWLPSRRVAEHGGKTLFLSGALVNSITSVASRDHVVVGTNTPYAAVHQFGAGQGQFGAVMGRTKTTGKRKKSQDYFTLLPWGDIPARPYLGISSEERETIGDIVAVHLMEIAG